MGPSNTHGAMMPSQRRAATKVSVLRTPCGTFAIRRLPLGQRPCSRVILVFAQVSSMKINRPAVTFFWCCFHCRRRRDPVRWRGGFFFKAQTKVLKEMPDAEIIDLNAAQVA